MLTREGEDLFESAAQDISANKCFNIDYRESTELYSVRNEVVTCFLRTVQTEVGA